MADASCCAIGCLKTKRKNPGFPFINFPLDPLRCLKWIIECRRLDFLFRTPRELQSGECVCYDHFGPDEFVTALQRIKRDACPKLFTFDDVENEDKPMIPEDRLEQLKTLYDSAPLSVSTDYCTRPISDLLLYLQELTEEHLTNKRKRDSSEEGATEPPTKVAATKVTSGTGTNTSSTTQQKRIIIKPCIIQLDKLPPTITPGAKVKILMDTARVKPQTQKPGPQSTPAAQTTVNTPQTVTSAVTRPQTVTPAILRPQTVVAASSTQVPPLKTYSAPVTKVSLAPPMKTYNPVSRPIVTSGGNASILRPIIPSSGTTTILRPIIPSSGTTSALRPILPAGGTAFQIPLQSLLQGNTRIQVPISMLPALQGKKISFTPGGGLMVHPDQAQNITTVLKTLGQPAVTSNIITTQVAPTTTSVAQLKTQAIIPTSKPPAPAGPKKMRTVGVQVGKREDNQDPSFEFKVERLKMMQAAYKKNAQRNHKNLSRLKAKLQETQNQLLGYAVDIDDREVGRDEFVDTVQSWIPEGISRTLFTVLLRNNKKKDGQFEWNSDELKVAADINLENPGIYEFLRELFCLPPVEALDSVPPNGMPKTMVSVLKSETDKAVRNIASSAGKTDGSNDTETVEDDIDRLLTQTVSNITATPATIKTRIVAKQPIRTVTPGSKVSVQRSVTAPVSQPAVVTPTASLEVPSTDPDIVTETLSEADQLLVGSSTSVTTGQELMTPVTTGQELMTPVTTSQELLSEGTVSELIQGMGDMHGSDVIVYNEGGEIINIADPSVLQQILEQSGVNAQEGENYVVYMT